MVMMMLGYWAMIPFLLNYKTLKVLMNLARFPGNLKFDDALVELTGFIYFPK